MLHTFNLPGNWTLEVDETTNFLDLYFTHPKTGKRALYHIAWGKRRHASLPEYQPLVHEVAREDGTIGLVCPMVAKLNGKWYIAVERAERHGGKKTEVPRKSWDNPSEVGKLPEGVVPERHKLGLHDSNTARSVSDDEVETGGGIVDEIVILKGLTDLPDLPGKPTWMKLETYGKHRDGMGLTVLAKAYIKGLIN